MIPVTIDRIAAGGDGVGRHPDGRVVFVPRTGRGDEVDVEIVVAKKRYLRGWVRRHRAMGEGRIAPRCRHYTEDRCGGCQLQHLDLAEQRAAKSAIVGDALRRIGKRDVPDPEVASAPHPWRYRTKVTLRVALDRRGRARHAGYHEAGRPGRIFALDDCLLADERLMELWRDVRPHLDRLPRAAGLVLKADRTGGLHLVVRDARAEPVWDAAGLAERVGRDDVCYWWEPDGGAARAVWGPNRGGPALAFEQSSPELAARIRAEAVERLGDVAGRVVWDLYGGVGDTAALLAGRGAEVWSVDADRAAIEWAAGRRLPSATHLKGRVEDVLPRLPEPSHVVVNPPRAGIGEAVAARLEGLGAAGGDARLAYISCDPATLARDLDRLPSWRVVEVRAYDLFPQTAHVETLAVLEVP